ncbi:hypothetical protein BH10PAT4_BH10PAT4_2200 [soil metagenome]
MLISFVILTIILIVNSSQQTPGVPYETKPANVQTSTDAPIAINELEKLAVKGRAPKTDYTREQFGSGWTTTNGCDTRNIILNRDLTSPFVDEGCNVQSGTLNDPYTGTTIEFKRGTGTSSDVQVDHVVALSDAWQKGAQLLTKAQRIVLANDPLELLAVDGPANQQKSDGDAATWLPSHKPFRCQYVARQIAVKIKYSLWVTQAEKDAIKNILSTCPDQTLPIK